MQSFSTLKKGTQDMTTNAHILTLNDRLCTIRNIVRSQPDGVEKLTLMTLIDDALDHLMEANTDMGNAVRKVAMLSDQISSLSRSIYEPVISTQYRYPEEGDYNAVREYVEHRKEHDAVFKNFCHSHSRADLCNRLTEEFGWPVDARSYGKNLQRH